MMHKLIKNLQDKHDAWIGNRADQVTSAEADGFKEGLSWAIEVAKELIKEAKSEEQYNIEEEVRNISIYDDNSDGFSILT